MKLLPVVFLHPHLYSSKPALKERIRNFIQNSEEILKAVRRGTVAFQLLGGAHKSCTDSGWHFTGQFLPLSRRPLKIHIRAPTWSVPPDYLEEDDARVKGGAHTAKEARGFGLKK